jgi:hypothetical protein
MGICCSCFGGGGEGGVELASSVPSVSVDRERCGAVVACDKNKVGEELSSCNVAHNSTIFKIVVCEQVWGTGVAQATDTLEQDSGYCKCFADPFLSYKIGFAVPVI